MKKIYTILVLVFSLFLLAGCADKKVTDDSIRVLFYKYQRESISDPKNPELPVFEKYKEGDLIREPEEPTREAFHFIGWYTNPQRTKEWNFETDRVGKKTIILYAKWEARNWEVKFVLNGGNPAKQFKGTFDEEEGVGYEEVDSEGTLIFHEATREGHIFLGWFPYDAFGWKPEDGRDPVTSHRPGEAKTTQVKNVTGDLVYYAHWQALISRLTLTVNYPGSGKAPKPTYRTNLPYGTILDFETIGYNDLIDPMGEYIFIGWNTAKDQSGKWYNHGDEYNETQNVTVYGIWEKK